MILLTPSLSSQKGSRSFERLKRSYISKHQKQEYETPTSILNEFSYGERRQRSTAGEAIDEDPFVKSNLPQNIRLRTRDINRIIQQKFSNVLDYSALFFAPVLWGSYSPMIKGLYSTPGMHAPPPLMFDFISTIVSFSTLRLLSHYHGGQVHGMHSQPTAVESSSQSNDIFAPMAFDMNGGSTTTQSASIWKGGLECGFWLYFGDTLLLLGLQSTSAIRGAIFAQLSTVLVPLIDSLWFSKQPVRPKIWVSCFLGMFSSYGDKISHIVTNPNTLFTPNPLTYRTLL